MHGVRGGLEYSRRHHDVAHRAVLVVEGQDTLHGCDCTRAVANARYSKRIEQPLGCALRNSSRFIETMPAAASLSSTKQSLDPKSSQAHMRHLDPAITLKHYQ